MAIHNKSHHNHGLMSINSGHLPKTALKHMTAADFEKPESPRVVLNISDCCEFRTLIQFSFMRNYAFQPAVCKMLKHFVFGVANATHRI